MSVYNSIKIRLKQVTKKFIYKKVLDPTNVNFYKIFIKIFQSQFWPNYFPFQEFFFCDL
jgi:hypothetical protein